MVLRKKKGAEERRKKQNSKIPVTVITGFLGSGKTTMLNHILSETHGEKFVVIENEFGTIGVDDKLVKRRLQHEGMELLQTVNGCICCDVRGDLVDCLMQVKALIKPPKANPDNFAYVNTAKANPDEGLSKLPPKLPPSKLWALEEKEKGKTQQDSELDTSGIQGVLIETTGVADPMPIVQTFFASEEISSQFRIDSVVSVVDAAFIIPRLEGVERKEHGVGIIEKKKGKRGYIREAAQQVAFADVLVVNKLDLISKKVKEDVIKRLRQVNTTASILEANYGKVDVSKIINIGAMSLSKMLMPKDEGPEIDHDEYHLENTHLSTGFKAVAFEIKGELDLSKVNTFLSNLLQTRKESLFRAKGVLAIQDMGRKFAFQAVHSMFGGERLDEWGPDEPRVSKFVFIGHDLPHDDIQKGAKACLTHSKLSEAEILERKGLMFGSGDGFRA
ncbi:hypothetical protein AAMO2058_001271800 [Amorphochlora amoebiformis]